MPARSQTMAECFLRRSWFVHDVRNPSISAPTPMRKQPTGEPVAEKLHTGFGGRGRQSPSPPPILCCESVISNNSVNGGLTPDSGLFVDPEIDNQSTAAIET
jgi:hypothetical protein